MSRRWARHFTVALFVLVPALGCYSPQLNGPLWTGSGKPTAPGSKKQQELPPEQAAEVCLNLGRTLEKNGHDLEAAGQYEKAREYNPHVDVAHRLAVVHDRLGNYPRALAEYGKALEAHPKDPDLLNDLGYHHYCRGQWLEAEKQLRLALAVNGSHRAAWINLGMTLGQQERYSEALEAFGKVVGPAEAKCNLAFVLTTQGKRDQAKQQYREALALEPDLRLAKAALAKLENPGQPAAPKTAARSSRPARPQMTTAAAPPAAPAPLPESALTPAPAPDAPMPTGTESASPSSSPSLPLVVLPPPPQIAKPPLSAK
jgi:tetratricopeptide (TPR) repeat protein